MLAGRGKVFIAMGGNFAAATPDTAATWRALRQCELTVHITTKFNRSHVVHGRQALVLPVLGRPEIDLQATGPQGVTVEDSMSMVHLSHGMNAPASPHLLSEPVVVARMAAATLPAQAANATCEAKAAEKKLAGAAKNSFMNKCERESGAAAAASAPASPQAACEGKAAEKKLAGAAKSSFVKKCVKDAG